MLRCLRVSAAVVVIATAATAATTAPCRQVLQALCLPDLLRAASLENDIAHLDAVNTTPGESRWANGSPLANGSSLGGEESSGGGDGGGGGSGQDDDFSGQWKRLRQQQQQQQQQKQSSYAMRSGPPQLRQLRQLQAFLAHIRYSVARRPHVLIAYAWVFYMALFSGGRWIRAQLHGAGERFWTEPAATATAAKEDAPTADKEEKEGSRRPTNWGTNEREAKGAEGAKEAEEEQEIMAHQGDDDDDEEEAAAAAAAAATAVAEAEAAETEAAAAAAYHRGYSFLCFAGAADGEDIKARFKARFLAATAEPLLSRAERADAVAEAVRIFRFCIALVHELHELHEELGSARAREAL